MLKYNQFLRFKISIFFPIVLLFLLSCEVNKTEIAKPVTDTEETPPVDDNPIVDQEEEDIPNTQDLIIIGNGSGTLSIKNTSNKNYKITPGTYQNIIIEDIQNSSINGFGQVRVENGDIIIKNINGLILSGLSIENYGQTAIKISEDADNLTLQDLKLKNINNTVITFSKNKKYDGSAKSYSENIHLKNIQAENIGTLFGSSGNIEKDGFYGLIKGFELSNSTIINSPKLSNAIYLGLAEDYIISNNVINNVNSKNIKPEDGGYRHDGIFFAQGNGKIFGNKITNHEGNAVRAWLFSISNTNALVEIYDNIVYNSIVYGAFELQVRDDIKVLPTFKPANAKIYNNTVGKLNTNDPSFFAGKLLDLYQTYGQVEIYNNLSFDLKDNILINNMSDPKDTRITKNSDNIYFKTANEAVLDLINFKSKVANIGAN